MTVLAFENDKIPEVIRLLLAKGIPFFELVDFFEFTTLDEVEAWWLDK